MARARDRIARAAQRAEHGPTCTSCGYEADAGENLDTCPRCGNGQFADPLPVQKVAIEEGFRQAAEDPTFDIWTVVSFEVYAERGDPLAENFARIGEAYFEQVDKPELRERLQEIQAQMEDAE